MPACFKTAFAVWPGLDLSIDHEATLGERTEPDLVVAFTLAFEMAALGEEEPLELGGKG